MAIDALLPGVKDRASLKYHTYFTGLSIAANVSQGGRWFTQDITGTDTLTNYSMTDLNNFFGGTSELQIHNYIEDTATIGTNPLLVPAHLEVSTPTSTLVTIPQGANDLYLQQHTRASAVGAVAYPQMWLTVYNGGDAATNSEAEDEVFFSTIFELPSTMSSILTEPASQGHYYVIFDWKTGRQTDGVGDYRTICQLSNFGSSTYYFVCAGDNLANGYSPTIPQVGSMQPSSARYWRADTQINLANWVGKPLRFMCYIKRPTKKWEVSSVTETGASSPRYEQDETTGITGMWIEDINAGTITELCLQRGGRQMGAANLEFQRRWFGWYCAGSDGVDPFVTGRLTSYQFWDTYPTKYSYLFDVTYAKAKFYAPLRGSLALTNGTGSATFTRATACWEFNHIGKLVSIPSGAARMRGYRPVINRVTSSEGAFSLHTGASSSTGNVDVPAGKNCTTSTKLVENSATSSHSGGRTISAPMLGTYKVRQYIKPAGRTEIRVSAGASFPFPSGSSVFINLSTGSVTGTASAHVSATLLTDGWVEVTSTHSPTSTGSHSLYIELRSGGSSTYTGDGTSGVLNTGVMAVNITPNALATVPEYVSVGVLSSPWHGAGADGVKYFSTYEDGTDIADADYRGVGLNPNQIINTLLYCRDLTNAVWVKTGITPTLNQTGLDNQSNSCSLLTAATTDGTALQTITAAAAAACSGFYVKRSVGSGSIYFTRDGGTNWTDITNLINNSTFTFVKIENTSVTNPQVGFKIATSGDAIIVDAGINHLGTKIASCPILTTSASVTVNAETLTYPTTYNIENAQGTILATFTADSYTSGMGNIVGSSTAGLATSSSYTCQAKDGTNTVSGSAASPSGTVKIGMAWDANLNTMYAIGENGIDASGSYDDSLGLSTIAILPSVDGYVKDVANFNRVLSSEEIKNVFNS